MMWDEKASPTFFVWAYWFLHGFYSWSSICWYKLSNNVMYQQNTEEIYQAYFLSSSEHASNAPNDTSRKRYKSLLYLSHYADQKHSPFCQSFVGKLFIPFVQALMSNLSWSALCMENCRRKGTLYNVTASFLAPKGLFAPHTGNSTIRNFIHFHQHGMLP